jgi:hypothetical protein
MTVAECTTRVAAYRVRRGRGALAAEVELIRVGLDLAFDGRP